MCQNGRCRKILNALRQELLRRDLHGVVSKIYCDVSFYPGDGRLNLEEYIQLMEQQKKPEDTEDDIVQAFRVFDSDNKGYIESAELRELLENMDWKVSADELKDLITSANLHQDRRIGMEGTKNSTNMFAMNQANNILHLVELDI